MIDDKKIEEAANKHIGTEYARYNSGEVEEEMICLRGKESFKKGAKWMQEEFLKDLWHPASEEPRKEAKFLYQSSHDSKFYYYINKTDDILETYPNWSRYVRHVRVIQWLYIDDLLPKEGGE
jgi:hypothetical protein